METTRTITFVKELPEGVKPDLDRMIESGVYFAPDSPDEQLGEYTVRKWTWYERQQATERASEVLKVGDMEQVTLSGANLNSEMMGICVTAPHEQWNVDFIKTLLDPVVGQRLILELSDLNGINWAEKRGFLQR